MRHDLIIRMLDCRPCGVERYLPDPNNLDIFIFLSIYYSVTLVFCASLAKQPYLYRVTDKGLL